MQYVGTCIVLALPRGMRPACEGVCVRRRKHQELLRSSTASGNGADCDPKSKVRLDD